MHSIYFIDSLIIIKVMMVNQCIFYIHERNVILNIYKFCSAILNDNVCDNISGHRHRLKTRKVIGPPTLNCRLP